MASEKLRAAMSQEGEELKLEMSPMIDLVFLLLIFFMVSSHLIIVQIDKNVRPPTAKNAEVAATTFGRIVVNIYEDGRVFGGNKNELATMQDISSYVDENKLLNDGVNVKSRLHLRADKFTDTRNIKKVVQAAAEVGVHDVIFSSYKVERK